MAKHIVWRLLGGLVTLFAVVVFTYFVMYLAPGDPATVMLVEGATEAQIQALRERMGLDLPFYIQLGRYLGRLIQGDMGTSIYLGVPVADLIRERLPLTMALAFGSLFISTVAGIFMGIIAALRKGSIIDQIVMTISILGLCMPTFWRGLVVIIIFGATLRWFPISGAVPLSQGFVPWLHHLFLPWITMALGGLAVIARTTRAGMLEELDQDYVRNARAKGLSERTVVYRHVFRNTLIPLITIVGLQLGYIMGGAVVTETVFSLPGLGRLMVRAILFRDFPIIQGSFIVIVTVFVLINIIVDILYGFADARVRDARH